MDNPVTYTSAFLLGLFSTVHCVGMCGGIIGALSLSLPVEIRSHKLRMLAFVTTYNIGRIISYGLAGLVAGAVGTAMLASTGLDQGHGVLRAVGIIMMIAIGLYLAGWLPQLASVEKIGVPIWRKLEPLGRRLLPVASLPKAIAYGLIWGWLPCGLVYSALLLAATTGGALPGALGMALFGIGTVPPLLVVGLGAGALSARLRQTLTRVAGVLIIFVGLQLALRGLAALGAIPHLQVGGLVIW